jgi:hypothetical protein
MRVKMVLPELDGVLSGLGRAAKPTRTKRDDTTTEAAPAPDVARPLDRSLMRKAEALALRAHTQGRS